MDFEGIMLSEISQRKTNTVRSHLYVESKNKKQTKNPHRYREQIGGCQGWGWRWAKWVKEEKDTDFQL